MIQSLYHCTTFYYQDLEMVCLVVTLCYNYIYMSYDRIVNAIIVKIYTHYIISSQLCDMPYLEVSHKQPKYNMEPQLDNPSGLLPSRAPGVT